jgi:hypothetical protein
MERSLFGFIIRYSKRDQLLIVPLVVGTMVVYYLSLDLPKTIINQAIQGSSFPSAESVRNFLGLELHRIPYLFALSILFLSLIVLNGWLKFQINTMKGWMGERMLRRLRFQLYDLILRFPVTRFRRVKAAEMATMIKDEVEPLGGFIGEAIITPLFLGGQALTAMVFILYQQWVLGLVALAVVFAVQGGGPVLAPFGVGLAVYVMIGALIDPIERIGLFRVPFATAWARARGLPRSAWGTSVAHFAAGMLLFGVIAESQWNAERIVSLKPGESVSVRGYDLTLEGLVPRPGPNYRELIARFTVRQDGAVIDVLTPSKRTFPQRSMSTTEAALLTRGASQLYLSLGDVNAGGAIAVRLYHKPLVLLIWFGAVVMVLGGALSLSDRRLRIGAPKPARKPALQPAE